MSAYSAPLIQGKLKKNICCENKKIFFRPDCTVGTGVSPVQFTLPAFQKRKIRKRKVAGYTAGRELHPTLKTFIKDY